MGTDKKDVKVYPDPRLKEQYKFLNYVIIFILAIFIITCLFLYKNIYSSSVNLISGSTNSADNTLWSLLKVIGLFLINTLSIIFLLLAIDILITYEIRIYYSLAILSIVVFIILKSVDFLWYPFEILLVAVLVLSVFLKFTLFPNVPLWKMK
ncbi:MAG: hypothetical protein ACOYT4_03140 [Nanoarchaeota archaeon]